MKHNVFARLTRRRAERNQWRQTFAALVQAAVVEAHQFEITQPQIQLAKLPRSFHGLRMAQLSDVHHSPFLSQPEIAEAVRCVNALQPEIIVLTGDYVSHSREYIGACAEVLGELRAPLGVYAVLGNHDHWTDGPEMAAALERQNIRVLTNEHCKIEANGAHIRLLGVDDLLTKHANLPQALAGTSRDETRILLSHNPTIIREAARAGIDLVLSGHTHGGQINWRLLTGREERRRWLRRKSRRFMRGHSQLGDTQIYVNRGLGTVVVPMRYGCTPEITLMELQTA
jgi:predicted MPP superfamily phosphohydrolase